LEITQSSRGEGLYDRSAVGREFDVGTGGIAALNPRLDNVCDRSAVKYFEAIMKPVSIATVIVALAWVQAIVGQPSPTPKSLTNSIGMKLAWIPAGTFMMGSTSKEKGRGDDEFSHAVNLSRGFYLGVHLVTQEEWLAVMGNNPSEFQGSKQLPVDSVSWDDCQTFLRRLSEKEKKSYRLPTEAEWEYACRAGTTTPFHVGATLSTDQANYNGNFVYGPGLKGTYRAKTTPVGEFPPNAWGLYDMHGNLWQWCADWHGGLARKEITDPTGPKSGKNHILRGGSWGSNPVFCRSANRNFADPASRTEFYGFRVALDGTP
jgi:formylglycine-generating enzyme required for sulfatase activity